MPINSQIPLGVQPMQIQQQDPNSQMNALARVMQVGGMMDEQKLNALKVDEYKREVEGTNALNAAYRSAYSPDGTVDRPKLFATLANSGLGSKIPGVQKQLSEADAAELTRKKTELEMGLKRSEHAASLFTLAKDPQSYAVVRAMVKQQFGQDLPEQFDPNFVQGQIAMGQTITQKLAAEHQRMTLAETSRHNVTTEGETGRHNRNTEGIQVRGQNLVNQRAQDANANGRIPAGYRMAAGGQGLEFIPGGPADPNAAKRAAPTEFQGKAGMFGNRAAEADRIITELQGKYSPSAINTKQAVGSTPLIGGALEAGGNLMLSDGSQKAEQAQRDFVNAVLRLESGAAIGQSEFDNARKQYFPQPGDAPAVIQQKAANRKTAIQGLMNNARPGAVEPAKVGGATGGWSIQKVN